MNERERWLDSPRNVTRLVSALYALCAALLVADLFYDKQTHFAFEAWFGFFAVFGFVAYVFIVLSAKALRRLIRRPEDYYEHRGPGKRDA
ncbi:hypothetical protein AAG565_01920 [Fontimonas sp. SYSU GA230001]|uniref:hypothetical protein n=1 Tax=Fontimonas sp. SYSU GA230001 TaxID=3142450 RepID=UPI0032B522F8